MNTVETQNSPKKTPDSAGTESGALTNNTQTNGNTSDLTLHTNASTGKGELPSPSSPVRDAAKDYIQRGLCPIPIPYKQKRAIVDGWQKLRLTLDDIPQFFGNGPQNIGIILGEPSGGLVDIDLDAPEALELADAFLPDTDYMFGRASKPRSHRLYVVNPIPEKTIQFVTKADGMLVELRSTGGQTVFPPSVHETGERITFDQKGELTRVSADELKEKVARLAAAALLVRHWPDKGARQDTAMALAGGLARAGWDQLDIQQFILDIAQAAGDEESAQRVRCVERTEKRAQSDDPVTGWPRLSQLIGGQVVDRVRMWLMAQGTAKDRIQAIRMGKGKESEKHRKISAVVLDELRDGGVFYKTPYELYYFDQLESRLFPLDDVEFRVRINDRFDINGIEQTWKFVLEELHKEAWLHGTETTIHRFACYEGGVLYVYKGQDTVFRITAEGRTEVPNGTDGILFLNPNMEAVELSQEITPGELETVLRIPNFEGSEKLTPEQKAQLYRLWVFSLFFPSLLPTKPILLLLGVKGSGKSMGLRVLLRALFGKKAQVLTLSKEKEDAFLAAVTSQHVAALDNLDGEIKWLPNHLATAATGGDLPLRKLYTTNELARYPVRCYLALTSRDPDSLTRDDVVDRLLMLRVDRFKTFKSERQFLNNIDKARPYIWTELLQQLQCIVSVLQNMKEYDTTYRLADFASFALNVGPVLGIEENEVLELLEGMDSEKTDFALEHDPLFQTLVNWVRRDGMMKREWIDTRTLFSELQFAYSGPNFPCKNASVLSRQLKNLKNDLEGWFEIVGPQKLPGGNNRSYWKIFPGPKLEPPIQISDERQ